MGGGTLAKMEVNGSADQNPGTSVPGFFLQNSEFRSQKPEWLETTICYDPLLQLKLFI